jgi:hypothetical protein
MVHLCGTTSSEAEEAGRPGRAARWSHGWGDPGRRPSAEGFKETPLTVLTSPERSAPTASGEARRIDRSTGSGCPKCRVGNRLLGRPVAQTWP